MPDPRVSMSVRKGSGGAGIIDIKGEVTSFCEDVLMDAFGDATVGTTQAVVLNFDGLDYMNSGGIGLLVTLLIRANRQARRLVAVGLNDHYRQIFGVTRLDEAITIYSSEAEALAAVGP